MPFDIKCLPQGRELIEAATAIRNFPNLDKANKDRILGQLTGDALQNQWSSKTIRERTAEYIINGYLTAPTNISTNIFSALTQTVSAPIIRELETAIMKATKAQGYEDRVFGEGIAMLKSTFKNFGEMMAFFKEGYTKGFPLDTKMSAQAFGSSEKDFKTYTDHFGLGQIESAIFKGQVYEYGTRKIPGLLGKVLSQGARAGVGVDEAAKVFFRRREYDALAYRMAHKVAKEKNISVDAALKSFELDNLTPANYQAKITQMLGKMGFGSPTAEYNKFNNSIKTMVFQGESGPLLQRVVDFRAAHPLFGALIAPFVKTPANIINEGIAFVPVVGALHRRAILDPATGLFKGTDWAFRVKEKQSEWLAKQALGIASLAYTNHLVDQGLLTGSSPSGDKPKFSIKIGDTWYGYGRIEPLATVFGLAADTQELVNQYKKDPEAKQALLADIEKYGTLFLKGFADNITQKSFMEGYAKFFEAAVAPERNLKSFLQSYSTALIPAGVAAAARTVDPYEREVTTFFDKVKGRIPGVREELPLRYDITGEPIQRSLSEVWAGIKSKTPNEVQQAMESSGYVFTPSDKKIRGVDLNTEQLSEYRRLAGMYFTTMAKQTMALPQYQQADNSMKDLILKGILSKARSAASLQLAGTLFSTDEKFRKDFEREWKIRKGQSDELLREQGRL